MSELQDMLRVQARLHREQGANALGDLFENALNEIELLKKTYNQLFDAVQSEREQLAKANEQIQKLSIRNAELVEPLEKCPITRRELFMVIDGKPTYGGPYDSYTIPAMEGKPDEKWHERELCVERFDHDAGCWVDEEIIPLRIVSEDHIFDLEEQLAKANERVSDLESKLEAVTQEARIQACELDTQKGIVQSVQDKFNLRVYDFNISKALDIALNKFSIEKKCESVSELNTYFVNRANREGEMLPVYFPDWCNDFREQLRKEQE